MAQTFVLGWGARVSTTFTFSLINFENFGRSKFIEESLNVIKHWIPACLIPQNNNYKKTIGFVTNISVSTSILTDKNNNVMTHLFSSIKIFFVTVLNNLTSSNTSWHILWQFVNYWVVPIQSSFMRGFTKFSRKLFSFHLCAFKFVWKHDLAVSQYAFFVYLCWIVEWLMTLNSSLWFLW